MIAVSQADSEISDTGMYCTVPFSRRREKKKDYSSQVQLEASVPGPELLSVSCTLPPLPSS